MWMNVSESGERETTDAPMLVFHPPETPHGLDSQAHPD
jgi:hypothetical protein